MTKDKLFVHNDKTLEINKESISNMTKVVTSVLIKNKENDNFNNKTEEVNNSENLNDKSHYIKRIEELTDYVENYKKEAKEIIDLEQELIGKCDNLMDILDEMRNKYCDE